MNTDRQKHIRFGSQVWDAYADGKFCMSRPSKPDRRIAKILSRFNRSTDQKACVRCGKEITHSGGAVCFCDESLLSYGLRQGIFCSS